MKKGLILYLLFCPFIVFSQLNVTIQSQLNYKCDGDPCNYQGSSIIINEVMLTPSIGDGGMSGDNYLNDGYLGEWIELYNPDLCKSIDISCYYLGNNAPDYGNNGGGYRIPNNTIVPPGGFVVIRGIDAPAVLSNLLVQNGGTTIELIVDSIGVCLGGGVRLWFPNSGGWFAFYDKNGIPQDAISWNNLTNSCMSCFPCISSCLDCSDVISLDSYDQISSSKKNYVTNLDPTSYAGLSWKRIPDGGTWSTSASTETMGNCNSTCNVLPPITCNGSAAANVTGGAPPYNFLWNDSQAMISSTVTGLCEGNYCVTVTDVNGLTSVNCIDVFNFVPTVTYHGVDTLCINATPVNLALEYLPTGGSLSGSGIVGANFSPSIAGVGTKLITYYYEDINTCSVIDTQSIEVLPIPVANAGSNITVCKGFDATLTATGGLNYIWNYNNTPTQTIVIPNIMVNSTYTVTVSDAYCSNTSSVRVNVVPVAEAGPNQTICYGESAVLTGTGYSSSSFEWNTMPLSNTASVIVSPLDTTKYILTVTNQYCVSKDSMTLFVNPLPIADAGPDQTICKGSTVTFQANGGGSYIWSDNLGTQSVAHTIPLLPNFFTVTVTQNNCSAKDSVKVFVNPLPIIAMSSIEENCDKSNGVAMIRDSVNSINYIFLWETGDTSDSITGLSQGYYNVTITDTITGCQSMDSVYVENTPGPNAYFVISNHNPYLSEETVVFTDNSEGNINKWDWSLGNGSSFSIPSFNYIFEKPGSVPISLTVTDNNGCTDIYQDTIVVRVNFTFYMPNAFTPGIDGLNDNFGPKGENLDLNYYEMRIFDRWGSLVFETHDFDSKWNGTKDNKGSYKEAEQGVYVYQIFMRGKEDVIQEYVGNVTLLR